MTHTRLREAVLAGSTCATTAGRSSASTTPHASSISRTPPARASRRGPASARSPPRLLPRGPLDAPPDPSTTARSSRSSAAAACALASRPPRRRASAVGRGEPEWSARALVACGRSARTLRSRPFAQRDVVTVGVVSCVRLALTGRGDGVDRLSRGVWPGPTLPRREAPPRPLPCRTRRFALRGARAPRSRGSSRASSATRLRDSTRCRPVRRPRAGDLGPDARAARPPSVACRVIDGVPARCRARPLGGSTRVRLSDPLANVPTSWHRRARASYLVPDRPRSRNRWPTAPPRPRCLRKGRTRF